MRLRYSGFKAFYGAGVFLPIVLSVGVVMRESGFFLALLIMAFIWSPGVFGQEGIAYDPLPLSYADMNHYDQIAMEPFRNSYDSMSIARKAQVYGSQFEFMYNRKPNFDPLVLNPPPSRGASELDLDEDDFYQDAEVVDMSRSDAARPRIQYDPLPLTFAEMNPYDKIAMEPFRNRYDSMSVAQKAAVYGRQFEFMRNRKPNFDPDLLDSWESEDFEPSRFSTDPIDSHSYQPAKPVSAYEAKRNLYKPATPKKRRPKPKPRPDPQHSQQPDRPAHLLEALPGPWEKVEAEVEPEPEYEEEFEEDFDSDPDTPTYQRDNPRMENLRRGWNAADIMRGVRKR